jgi:3-hydroxyacyl-CoA dehydrogenase
LNYGYLRIDGLTNAPRDEALVHTFFAWARKKGEFFQVTPEEVKTFFANRIMAQYQVELAEHIAKAQGGGL